MITVYAYKGRSGSVSADYIPCLVGTDEQGEDAYFETVGEVQPEDILATRRSKWVSHPVLIISVKYAVEGGNRLGYVMADELMTAGVDF